MSSIIVSSPWIKFSDSNETVIKKEDISFFNKDEYEEKVICFSGSENLKKYQISVYLSKDELTQIRLNYDNKKNRDKDYKKIYNMF